MMAHKLLTLRNRHIFYFGKSEIGKRLLLGLLTVEHIASTPPKAVRGQVILISGSLTKLAEKMVQRAVLEYPVLRDTALILDRS